MKEERVNLSNVDIENLVNSTKQHFQEIGLQIIHEDKFENYWSLKAHKGGKLATVTGSIRDVEVLVTGANNNYELTLRTGAWGRDIAIPALLASTVSLGGAAAIAVAEIYRAHKFEKNFWDWLNKQVSQLGKKATITQPKVVTPDTSAK
jgi:CHAD domain-containing protein